MTLHGRHILISVVFALSVAACESAEPPPDLSQVVVSFDAEAGVAERALSIRLRVWSGVSDATEVYDRVIELAGRQFPISLPMTPLNGDATRTFRVQADLYDTPGKDKPFATVRAAAGYVQEKTTRLRLRFDDDCADVTCDAGMTCEAGICLGACHEASDSDNGVTPAQCGRCESCAENECRPRASGSLCGVQNKSICVDGTCEQAIPYFWCAEPPDQDTLAVYRMDTDDLTEGNLVDSAGALDGFFPVPPTIAEGPTGCGGAMGMGGNIGIIDDAKDEDDGSDWALDEGSIDMLVRLDAFPNFSSDPTAVWHGVFTKDAVRTANAEERSDEHFSLFVDGEGRYVLRLQSGNSVYLCATQVVEKGVWHHVGINFGPPAIELYVDGVMAAHDGTTAVRQSNGSTPCTSTPPAFGIAKNAEPWVLGADASDEEPRKSMDEDPLELDRAFFPARGLLDEFRVSTQRRDFAALFEVGD